MNKLMIFDLDGTLADTREDLALAVNLTRAHYSLPPVSVGKVAEYTGNGIRNLIERSFQDSENTDTEEAVSIFADFYQENIHVKTSLYEGVTEGLDKLSEDGVKLALLTNKAGPLCRKLVKALEIEKYFFAVIGGGDLANLKPAPDGIHELIKKAEEIEAAKIENVWMIGDNHTDLKAAINGGVKSVFCNYGFGHRDGLIPDYEIESFSELISLIG